MATQQELLDQKPIPESGDNTTVQPPVPYAAVDPTLQEQSNAQYPNYDLTQNIVAGTTGLPPEQVGRIPITSAEQDAQAAQQAKDAERQKLLNLTSPEQQSKVQMATQLGTSLVSTDETKQQIIDRIMNDDSIPLSEKTKAIEQLKNSNSALSKETENLAAAKIAEQRSAYEAKLKEVTDYNKAVEGTPYAPKPVPSLSDFGLSPKATEQDAQAAATPTVEQVKQIEAPLKNEVAKSQAIQNVQNDQVLQQQKKVQLAQQSVQDQDSEIKAIDPNRFWNSRTTWDRVLLGLGLAASGYAAGLTGGKNQALDYVMNMVDKDIEAQKLTNDQKLAKQKQALEKMQTAIKAQESMASTSEAKARTQRLYQEIDMQKQAIHDQQLKQAYLKSGGGLQDSMLTDKERERAVDVNGNLMLARNPESMKAINKYRDATDPSKQALDEILALRGSFNKLNPIDRGLMESRIKALSGLLRVQIVGPGVFQESEKKLVEDVVGNPNSIFSLPDQQWKKLQQMSDTMNSSYDNLYKQHVVGYKSTQSAQPVSKFINEKARKLNLSEDSIARLKEKYGTK